MSKSKPVPRATHAPPVEGELSKPCFWQVTSESGSLATRVSVSVRQNRNTI